METMRELLGSVEFWMGLSLAASAIPGPQTRLLPVLFRAVAKLVTAIRQERAK